MLNKEKQNGRKKINYPWKTNENSKRQVSGVNNVSMMLQDYIKNHFSYNNGALIRNDRANSSGSLDAYGYLVIKVKGHQLKAHRIVWLLCKGELPNGEIDHINRNKTDNRIENLRIATRRLQNLNKDGCINPDTGVVGVYLDKSTNGLKARYTFRSCGKTYRFRNLDDAVKKRQELIKGETND